MYLLDTAKGTLAYTPIGETDTTTIPFQLTDAEAGAISQKAVEIKFFGYPSQFVVPDKFVHGTSAPYAVYELTMRNAAFIHSVTWSDDAIVDPPYDPAEQLRDLMDLIQRTIRSHPEVKQLPPPKGGCA
jgi:hypothetical protein